MFDYISGKIAGKHPTRLIIDVAGVGYDLQIPLSTYNKTGKIGDHCKIYTELVVRQESWTLYGFADEEERALFKLLMTVSGVGPKSALAALSGMSVQQIRSAIASNDAQKLTLIPGVGKKTAQRIALELKDKVKTLPGEAGETIPLDAEYEEAVLALEALGYHRHHAERAVAKVMRSGGDEKAGEILRRALGFLAGK
ncbi:MAG: Holliday junction branch migration protein RuvA [candidate division Zixibacteria bacterium]|nr:Holliday junction branch migration protein RuvA [Candidatus Tariuqbacter arcticus]